MAPRAKTRKATESIENGNDQVVTKPPATKRVQSAKKPDDKINNVDQVVSKKKAEAKKGGKIDDAPQAGQVNGGADVEIVKGKRGKKAVGAVATVENTKSSEIIEHEENTAAVDSTEESATGNGRKTGSKRKTSKKATSVSDTKSKKIEKEETKLSEKKPANSKTETKRKGKNSDKHKETLPINEPPTNGILDEANGEAEPLINGDDEQKAKISPEKKGKRNKKITAKKTCCFEY